MIKLQSPAAVTGRTPWSAEQLTAILHSVADGVTVQDPRGALVYANEVAVRLLGFSTLDELLATGGDAFLARLDLLDEAGRPLALADLPGRNVLRGEPARPLTVRYRTRSTGAEGWLVVDANAVHDESGTLEYVVHTFHDITERVLGEHGNSDRRAREHDRASFLAEASRLLAESLDEDLTTTRLARLAVPTIGDWCVIDLLGDDGSLRAAAIAHVDEAKMELARRLREQHPPDPNAERGAFGVMRSGRPALIRRISPDDIERADPEIRQALLDLDLHSYMCVPLKSRGHALGAITFLAAESGREFGPSDLAVAEDLADRAATALENARLYRDARLAKSHLRSMVDEERARAVELKAIIGAMGEALLVVRADGRVTIANPAADGLFSDGSIETYQQLLDQFEDGLVAPRLGERVDSVELRVRGTEQRWLALSTYPVPAREGDTVGVAPAGSDSETIVLVRDVTDLRRRQAVHDAFIGVLSHELRTPLTTIFAGAKVLARHNSLSEETRAEIFDDIQAEVERLHRLVEDVVALNRFGEADGDAGREPVLVQRVMAGVVAAEEQRWPRAQFDLRIPPALPTVSADKTYVEQVLRNLLSNAAKYGGPEPRIEVTAEADDDEVRVRVRDNGPGFNPTEGNRLFELFYRSPSVGGSVSGAGIGLFVCRRLVHAMGGRTWSALRPEGGAEFGFALGVMKDD